GNRADTPFARLSLVELNTWQDDWADIYVDPGGFFDPYRKLPASQRQRDLLVEDATADTYWNSEYATSTGPVRFRCGFVLHFSPLEAAETRVTVYEMTPVIWVGEHWAFAKEGLLPGRFHDIRFVEPTVTDRQKVLDWIDHIVHSSET